MLFLFFKQKTAYEMRISDWSSDVCSSDLANGDILNNSCAGWRRHSNHTPFCLWRLTSGFHPIPDIGQAPLPGPWDYTRRGMPQSALDRGEYPRRGRRQRLLRAHRAAELHLQRPEEHTSELQSLMRTSYAVFCLKKNKVPDHTELILLHQITTTH